MTNHNTRAILADVEDDWEADLDNMSWKDVQKLPKHLRDEWTKRMNEADFQSRMDAQSDAYDWLHDAEDTGVMVDGKFIESDWDDAWEPYEPYEPISYSGRIIA